MNKQLRFAALEDDHGRTDAMKAILRETYPNIDMTFIENAPDIIQWFESNLDTLSLISLDHDLGANFVRDGKIFDPGIGRDVSKYLATRKPVCPIIVHSTNTFGSIGMKSDLDDAGWSCERIAPYNDLLWVKEAWLPMVIERLPISNQAE